MHASISSHVHIHTCSFIDQSTTKSPGGIAAAIWPVHMIWWQHYSTGHRQRHNETRLNAFGDQTQTRLHSPPPSNGGNSQALKAWFLLEAKLLLANQPVYSKRCFKIRPS